MFFKIYRDRCINSGLTLFYQIMKIEEAIIYVIAKRNGGMTTDQIAEAINRSGLYMRKENQPVTGKHVLWVVSSFT